MNWVILAYVIGLGLLWGYALSLWLARRNAQGGPEAGGRS